MFLHYLVNYYLYILHISLIFSNFVELLSIGNYGKY